MKNKILNIKGVYLINREQQKQISGGKAGGTCAINWNGQVFQGLSLYSVTNAMGNMNQGDSFQWCCDSCGSASWL